jgi:transcriptional regulator with GAF, ATPase, and Fis domain
MADHSGWPALQCDEHGVLSAVRVAERELRRLVASPARFTAIVVATDVGARMLEACPAGVVAERRKNDSRPLAQHLTRKAHVVYVRTNYRDAGQTERGIRTLCAAAHDKMWRGVFITQVSPRLFTSLSERAVAGEVAASAGNLRYIESGDHSQLERLVKRDFKDVVVARSVADAFVGGSLAAEWVRRQIMLAARNNVPVLILGETGTGKEVVARQIHLQAKWTSGTIETVNCAAIPPDLLESELFGHLKGAFTGAVCDKLGLWMKANNGTLFLDEIGDLSDSHQAKVLRALDSGEIRRVGDLAVAKSNARVIAATHRNLCGMVHDGSFREDLYHRLLSFPIRTPALREHLEDIPLLAQFFWRGLLTQQPPGGRPSTEEGWSLPEAVCEALTRYPWPGNARELRSFLAHLHTLAHGRVPSLELVHLAFSQRAGTAEWTRRDA